MDVVGGVVLCFRLRQRVNVSLLYVQIEAGEICNFVQR